MAWGFSRDDVEAAFFSRYFEHGIFDVSPFESLDQLGVGGMVEMGTTKGRETKPDLKVGVCGEHGGDPRSIHFFDRRARLRLVLAVPGAGRAARGRPLGPGEAGPLRTGRTPGSDGPPARAGRRCRPRRRARAGARAPWRGPCPTYGDEVDQPGEGVLDVPAEQVEVGDQGLRVDVVGVWPPPPRARPEVGAPGALHHLGHREPGGRLGVRGLASTSFWYSATAPSMSSASSASWAGA